VFYYDNHHLKQYQAQTFNTIKKEFADTLISNVIWQNNKIYKIYQDSLVVE
jgi:hypothetical protein